MRWVRVGAPHASQSFWGGQWAAGLERDGAEGGAGCEGEVEAEEEGDEPQQQQEEGEEDAEGEDEEGEEVPEQEQDEGDHEARGAAGHVGGQINCWWQLNEAARPADEGPSAIPRRRSRSRSGFST